MYHPPPFQESDPAVVIDLMRRYPFAVLSGASPDGVPVATQLPLLIREAEGQVLIRGHFMRGTPHHAAFEQNPNALAIFSGPHCYVSASWYANQQQASTWNYMTVQASGKMRFLDKASLLQILEETTAQFEANAESPARFEKIPTEYVHRLSKAIVAFEIPVTSLENTFKLSQNRDRASFDNIRQHLASGNEAARAIAAEMAIRSNLIQ